MLQHRLMVHDLATRVGKWNATLEVMLDDFWGMRDDVDVDSLWVIATTVARIKVDRCVGR